MATHMATQTQPAANDANSRTLKHELDKNAPGAQTTNVHCPDPSAHHRTKNSGLQDQASAAALYSTKRSNTQNPLGSDGKLSSASAATSLKQARAQDLPGYPIVGIDARSSAGTAANLAHANQKSPEWWKPEQSAAAGKAALLAHDYKSAPVWQPGASAAGSKAALLAHRDGAKINLWQPEASADGNSAANIAFRKKTPGIDHTKTKKPNGALLAATGAISNSGRKRAHSTPPVSLYPDSENSARNALSAATMAHSPSTRSTKPQTPVIDSNRFISGAMEAARIQHSKSISRDMYTSNPPVALEVEEKRHNDALRASAISMAKKMYDIQQNNVDQAAGRASKAQGLAGAASAHGQQPAPGGAADIKQQPMRYIGIQEVAQKLAAERLAKIGPDQNAAFRSYYGYEKPRSKLTIRRGRNRASSNPEPADDSSDDDDFRSMRIRSQMSQFNQSLAEVDAKKQDQDRKNLMAAAEKKVHAQMLAFDKKIFDDTGKMSPAMMEEWDAKARAKAAANSEARMEHHGKIHIGHGKFVDQADVNVVAQARIQPTLDEITEKTEKRRAEEEEQRLEMEEKKRQTQTEKEHAAELKAEQKRIKDGEKAAANARTAEEKAAARQEKEAQKKTKAEEKRKSRDRGALVPTAGAGAAAGATTLANVTTPNDPAATGEAQNDDLYRNSTPAQATHASEAEFSNPASPTSPTSPKSPKPDGKGFKSFLNKFKRRSKHSSASADSEKPGFIGGNALRGSSSTSHHTLVHPSPAPEPTESTNCTEPTQGFQRRYSDVSSISSGRASSEGRGRTLSGVSVNTEFEEARDDFDEKLAPPVSFGTGDADAARKGSPNRDSKFQEVGI